ncbi:MAG: glycerophosphodiester phosphodiesterase family protein [Hyphomicrobiaceae bacterium]
MVTSPAHQDRPTLDRAFLRPIAHRGLHDAAAGRIENTAPAFEAALACSYGIECDLRPLADGTPIVFHDETLTRLIDDPAMACPHFSPPPCGEGSGVGVDANVDTETLVSSLTPADLTLLHYGGTTTPILTFEGLLTLVAGAVPLFVEIKSEWTPPDPAFLARIATLATAYRGPIALMSFDPAVIAALHTLAPTIPRGLVSGSYHSTSGDHWWANKLTPARAAHLRDLKDFDALACSFAAYECASLPTPATQALRARGIPIFTWTVRTPADHAHATLHADAPIFEGFLPPLPAS